MALKTAPETPFMPAPVTAKTGDSKTDAALASFSQNIVQTVWRVMKDTAYRVNRVLPKDGTEPMTGALDMGGHNVMNVGTVDSVDISDKVRFRGARVSKSAPQSITTSTITSLSWDQESFDTDTIHDNVTNNTRLTVPNGALKVELIGCIAWDSVSTVSVSYAIIRKNNTTDIVQTGIYSPAVSVMQNLHSGPVVVANGDYFELQAFQSSGAARNVEADTRTFFSMRVLEWT